MHHFTETRMKLSQLQSTKRMSLIKRNGSDDLFSDRLSGMNFNLRDRTIRIGRHPVAFYSLAVPIILLDSEIQAAIGIDFYLPVFSRVILSICVQYTQDKMYHV